jgi:hypothetical protein
VTSHILVHPVLSLQGYRFGFGTYDTVVHRFPFGMALLVIEMFIHLLAVVLLVNIIRISGSVFLGIIT